jgi:hypothetical protein
MGAGNPPRALTGRVAQIEQFRTLLGRLGRGMNEPSMVIFGLRGAGKTVLLLEFESIADSLGWMTPTSGPTTGRSTSLCLTSPRSCAGATH